MENGFRSVHRVLGKYPAWFSLRCSCISQQNITLTLFCSLVCPDIVSYQALRCMGLFLRACPGDILSPVGNCRLPSIGNRIDMVARLESGGHQQRRDSDTVCRASLQQQQLAVRQMGRCGQNNVIVLYRFPGQRSRRGGGLMGG